MSSVSVLGAGAWGTTLAQVLSDAGNDVVLWGRSSDVIDEINNSRTNARYLPGITLPSNIKATGDLSEAMAHSQTLVLAIPAQNLRSKLKEWKPEISSSATLISTVKGIEVSTLMRMSEVVVDVLGVKPSQVGIITGPNLAQEMAQREPAGAVAAADSEALSHQIQALFRTNYYRVYASTDVLGCEMAGAVKSVIALGVGIAVGLKLGENTQSMLVTRGLNEVARLAAAHGADPLSVAGLAGMGDLVASCASPLSRNRTFGEALGHGGTMEYAQQHSATTVEGVASAGAVVELAHRVGVEVPVIEAVADVVKGAITPAQALERLMEISTRSEDFIK
ncbi:MAG: NAD(P)H-dependent glycerol-3-phosphate dehydrogenase [Actinomycetes bacterium]|nr:NAD(P)-dependent glycerol-3-phosphate dehydrogenase [Actinomycetota bacterium]